MWHCRADKSDMQPVKPAMDMQSNRPAVPIQNKMSKKQIMPQEDDGNCQVNIKPVTLKLCADKKCQATKHYKKVDKNCQTTDMQPVKPPLHMWSVTRSSDKKLAGSASDKNCQATICYKKQKKS